MRSTIKGLVISDFPGFYGRRFENDFRKDGYTSISIADCAKDGFLSVGKITQALSEELDFVILPLTLPKFGSLRFAEYVHRFVLNTRVILASGTSVSDGILLSLFDCVVRMPIHSSELYSSLLECLNSQPKRYTEMDNLYSAISDVLSAAEFSPDGTLDHYQRGVGISDYLDLDNKQVADIFSESGSVFNRRELLGGESNIYDVAISYAAEDRNIVDHFAHNLANRGLRVFYDEFEKAKLWGKDLHDYLEWVYQEASKFCIMIISKHYASKVWTNHERKSAHSRALREKREYILPLRLDDTKIDGILDTTSYQELRMGNIGTITTMVIDKLKLLEQEKANKTNSADAKSRAVD